MELLLGGYIMTNRLKNIMALSIALFLAVPAPVNAGFFDRFSFFSAPDICGRVNFTEASWYAKAACAATAALTVTAAAAGYLGFNYWKSAQENNRTKNELKDSVERAKLRKKADQEAKQREEEDKDHNEWVAREINNLYAQDAQEIQELKQQVSQLTLEKKQLQEQIVQIQNAHTTIQDRDNGAAYHAQRLLQLEQSSTKQYLVNLCQDTMQKAQEIQATNHKLLKENEELTRKNETYKEWVAVYDDLSKSKEPLNHPLECTQKINTLTYQVQELEKHYQQKLAHAYQTIDTLKQQNGGRNNERKH